MQSRTKGLVAAVTGTALGATGLALIALPAGADDAPSLPEISAQELVTSALQADPPAFAGSVTVRNDLGLPEMPGMDVANFDSAKVFHDGAARFRVAVQDGNSEYTVVKGEDEVWAYDSAKNTATRMTPPADKDSAREHEAPEEMADPATAARTIVKELSETSDISVDGTARVADRAAYELVLTPQPTERTVLREVKVAIDSETRLPLRVEVMANGSPEPILSLGFDEFTVGEQPERLFEFTAPEGAKIVDGNKAAERAQREHREAMPERDKTAEQFTKNLKVVGEGWDTVVTGSVPERLLSEPRIGEDADERMNPQQLLERYGKRVSGEYGEGYLITTKAVSGLITDDGRFAAGAVPAQVLEQALAK